VGGRCNSASNNYASIVGGYFNTASAYGTFIGGGISNLASGGRSAILAGTCNTASGCFSFVGAGNTNIASGDSAFVGSGRCNLASGPCSTVVAGLCNSGSANFSFVGGGLRNVASGCFSFVGGGHGNTASGYRSTVVGGCLNTASSTYAVIVGGAGNCNNGNGGFIGGGACNTISSLYHSSILGGSRNAITQRCAAIAGGSLNTGSAIFSFIGGGQKNSVTSAGSGSFVVGSFNTSSAAYSNAIGHNLNANVACHTFVNNLSTLGNITASNASFTGTLTAQTLVVSTVSSSIVYSSGSNIFGNSTSNIQTFTGSVNITGSTVSLRDGSFSGSGVNLYGIPASGITGLNLSQIATGSVSASVNTTGNVFTVVSGSNTLMVLNSSGSLGIGSTSLAEVSLRVSKNITGGVSAFGLHQDGVVQSDVATVAYGYINRSQTPATTFTLPNYRHFAAAQGTIGAGSGITLQVGYYAESNLTSGATNYGFQGLIPVSGSSNWNLYMNGTAPNYIAGSLGIGTTGVTSVSLRVSKALTGATTPIGIFSDGAIQADATGTTTSIGSNVSVAAGVTSAGLTHYSALQGAIGSGASISTQVGYNAGGTLIGATTNYGFRGSIPLGSNRWNLFMDGSAQNYLSGSLGIGQGKTVPTAQLDISGSTLITGSLGVTGPITGSSILSTGTITAQTLVVTTVSSSVVYSSGSNIFGNSISNTQTFTGSINITGSTNFNQTFTDYDSLTSVSGSNTVYSRATGSFTSLFVKYAASSGSNSRAGETIVAWNANNVAITDYSTVDLGNTVGLRHTASVAAGTLTYSANTTTAGWTIKSLVTFI
jgi:hypothetical protein